MDQQGKYQAFKALHERPETFVIPNPWNAGTARILESLGFEALATNSAGYGFSVGKCDSADVFSREEIIENAVEIVNPTELPVSAGGMEWVVNSWALQGRSMHPFWVF